MARDIDVIVARLKAGVPAVDVELQVSHPSADNDGLWFINVSGHAESVQIESPDGNCPFLIESDSERLHAFTFDQVVDAVRRLLP
jgi:hypothetical protein